MDRHRAHEREQQIARIREIFESTKDGEPDDSASTDATKAATKAARTDRIDANDLLGDDLGPVARTPRARIRLAIDRRPAAAYAVVAIAAAVIAAALTWLSRPDVTPVEPEVAPSQIAATGEDGDDSTGAQSASGSEPEAGGGSPSEAAAETSMIVVSVVGMVATPGLVTLPDGARVSDAIAAAGGALPGTDLTTVNLARKVTDGEQIAVGVPGAADSGGAAGSATGGADPGSGQGGGAKVNLNSATVEQLDTLPGIGPVLAQSIVDYRDKNGPFGSIEQLAEVSGIGPAILAKVEDLVEV